MDWTGVDWSGVQAEEVLDDSEELDVDGAICDELDFEDFWIYKIMTSNI